MMTNRIHADLLLVGLPLGLLAFLVFLTRSAFYEANSADLSIGITLDFLITIPLLYFLLIRKREIPKTTVATVFVFSLIAASFILPAEDQNLLSQIKVIAIPIVELGVMAFLIFKTRKIFQRFKTMPESKRPDFFDAVTIACTESFPGRAGEFLSFELSVFYYLFSKKSNRANQQGSYTYFEKNGIKMVIGVFIGLIVIETVAMHLLVRFTNGVF